MTCLSGTQTCKSCYDGYTLVAGNCVACYDPSAIFCLPTNLNYSVRCYPKYSVEIYNASWSSCQPCADNCLQCDTNGPGNCDSSQCILGFVQLIGTFNCTACINSCPICDSTNLSTCLDCGPNRYSDEQGSCLACSSRCQTCTSATNCSLCQLGSTLINSTCYSNLGYPCATIGSNLKCNKCFQGYALSGSTCVLAASKGTFSQCPFGYYLIKSSCFNCSLTNCQACDSNRVCTLCIKGYYLNSGVCLSCPSNCNDCSSSTYCNQAADGYYLLNRLDKSNTGNVLSCSSPCLTCAYNFDYCLTCIYGYSISGSACISSYFLLVQVILSAGSSNTSIFSSYDSNDSQLSKSVKSVNRLLNAFCQIV